jgi:hypothetical protein
MDRSKRNSIQLICFRIFILLKVNGFIQDIIPDIIRDIILD